MLQVYLSRCFFLLLERPATVHGAALLPTLHPVLEAAVELCAAAGLGEPDARLVRGAICPGRPTAVATAGYIPPPCRPRRLCAGLTRSWIAGSAPNLRERGVLDILTGQTHMSGLSNR
jgi:hypothetical protein